MSRVYIGYDRCGIEGVGDEFVHFIFDVVIALTKLSDRNEVGLVITDDAHLRELNAQYRHQDRPTNILSFAYAETNPKDFVPKGDEYYLGDIYISYDRVEAQAKQARVRNKDEFARLFVHGLFHLAGVHHGSAKEAKRMEALEDRAWEHIAAAESGRRSPDLALRGSLG